MFSSPLYLVVLLLSVDFSDAVIQCLVSTAAEFGKPSHPVIGQCYQNWCKKVIGGSGLAEYSCDETGDCARNSNNDPYDPYVTQISNCWSKNGRSVCCCNTDYCNNVTGSRSLHASVLLSLLSVFWLLR